MTEDERRERHRQAQARYYYRLDERRYAAMLLRNSNWKRRRADERDGLGAMPVRLLRRLVADD